jgi:hypothetical protein
MGLLSLVTKNKEIVLLQDFPPLLATFVFVFFLAEARPFLLVSQGWLAFRYKFRGNDDLFKLTQIDCGVTTIFPK